MPSFSPKEEFQVLGYSDNLKRLITEQWFREAIVHALAHHASAIPLGSDMQQAGLMNARRQGAVDFVSILLNLPEKPKEVPIPRGLDYSLPGVQNPPQIKPII